jgi:hypothetical protein
VIDQFFLNQDQAISDGLSQYSTSCSYTFLALVWHRFFNMRLFVAW